MDEENRPGYYAIIPANVRYDDSIPANAKLLYGEISALIGSDGFCFASNQYFAKVYGLTEESISRLIAKLENAGYIVRELERDASGQVVRRKIFLSVSVSETQPLDNSVNQCLTIKSIGLDKKVKDTGLNIPISSPLNPPEGGGTGGKPKRKRSDHKAQADFLPQRFEKFWAFYRSHVPPDRNAGNRQKAIRAWDKLAPSDELATTMALALAKQVKSKAWESGIGVPHASTWLNNHGWEDDWGAAADEVPSSADPSENEEAAEWAS